jgi:signal transduction histidine kinase
MQLENAAPAAWRFRGARADLEEMIGNLLENGLKWGGARVRVSGERRADRLTLWVDDDGPGLADAACMKAFERGRRFDEAMIGTGLGLAIVRELAEIYGGTAALGGGPLGGLRATLDLPAI